MNDYEKELICQYKNETYSVRDNGSVLRHSRENKKPRPSDNVWTFGKYNRKTGYAEICGERVHRIVATAFHGPAPSAQHVVDHIDTNRRNNRPENLRWITRLENILLNPITFKKIEILCGSVEEFLKDPSKLQQKEANPDFEWMRAVTKEEGALTLERLLSWAESDSMPKGGSLREWIYQRGATKGKQAPEIIQNTAEEHKNESENKKVIESTCSQSIESKRGDAVVYRTNSELVGLLVTVLEEIKSIRLPNINVGAEAGYLVVEESCTRIISNIEIYYEGKSKIPYYMILDFGEDKIALVPYIKRRGKDFVSNFNLAIEQTLEVNLSRLEDGITHEEMKELLLGDDTRKTWLRSKSFPEAVEKFKGVCEEIRSAGGVLHHYVICPKEQNTVDYFEICGYCQYRVKDEMMCSWKANIENYSDLLSIVSVEREEGVIVGITREVNGETKTQKFSKEVDTPGKSLFYLWDKRDGDKVLAYNIYSHWYVLLEEDPNLSFKETGKVYAKLCGNPEQFEQCDKREIFSAEDYCWESVEI